VPTQRDLKINFNLFRTLQSALILNKNMDEIKEHRDLTEFQREKLIDFLKKNDACKKFLDGCKTYQTVEAGLKLKEYISTQLGKIKRKGVMKFLPVIYGAI
jgi:predicted Holliday junction resolvase-like endonuclease